MTLARRTGAAARQTAVSPRPAEASAPKIRLAALAEMVGFHVHILDLQQYQIFYERFADKAFTPGIFSVLLTLRDNPGISHGVLADALMVQRPNMTTLIKQLERDGYVSRRPAHGDKRSVALHLTGAGEQALERMRPAMAALEQQITTRLTEDERKTLLELLAKMAAGLRDRRPAGD